MILPTDENLCEMCDEQASELFDFEIEPHVLISICKNCMEDYKPSSSRIKNASCDLCGDPATCSDHYNNYCDDCYENSYGE